MVIKMGKFAQSDMDVGEQQSEIVEDKYTGEQFEIERNSTFITTLPHIINDIGCQHIIEQFINLPFADCDYENSQVTPPKEIEESGASYKYGADHNKDHATFMPNTKEFEACLSLIHISEPTRPY